MEGAIANYKGVDLRQEIGKITKDFQNLEINSNLHLLAMGKG